MTKPTEKQIHLIREMQEFYEMYSPVNTYIEEVCEFSVNQRTKEECSLLIGKYLEQYKIDLLGAYEEYKSDMLEYYD